MIRFALYNFIWHLLRPVIPILLRWRAWRGKEVIARLQDRYGLPHFDQGSIGDQEQGEVIWIHAVSVGETVAAIGLATALIDELPTAKLLITTNTVSAAAMVEKEIAKGVCLSHAFQPLDHPLFVDRFLAKTNPVLAIFIESDFWPNLITRTAAKSVPIVFASSQLSRDAFLRWQRQPVMAKAIFSAPQHIFAVNEQQASQFETLGADAARITVLGSLKLGSLAAVDPALCKQLKTAIGARHVLLAASTHEGEDASIIAAANALTDTEQGDNWLTIIAPRHPHRGARIAADSNHAPQRSRGQWPSPDHNIYIMDSFGELGSLFSLADLVVLGGAFAPKGGHNPLEPAAFGLPIITGPHIFKNTAEFAGLRDAGVVFDIAEDAVTDATATGQQLARLARGIIDDKDKRRQIAAAAKTYADTAARRCEVAAKQILDCTLLSNR